VIVVRGVDSHVDNLLYIFSLLVISQTKFN